LPQAASVTRNTVRYACEGLPPIRVEYINAGPNALAVVPVSGEAMVFANVLSGSGARYAAGRLRCINPGRITRSGSSRIRSRVSVQAPSLSGRDHPALRALVLQIRNQLP
jgi:hypothetical protein